MNNISLQNHENNIRLLTRKFEAIKFDETLFVYDHDLKYNVDENSEREIENDEKNDDNDASCEKKKSKRVTQKKFYRYMFQIRRFLHFLHSKSISFSISFFFFVDFAKCFVFCIFRDRVREECENRCFFQFSVISLR